MPLAMLKADIAITQDPEGLGQVLMLVIDVTGGHAAGALPLRAKLLIARDGVAIDRGIHGYLKIPGIIEREYAVLVQKGYAWILELSDKGANATYKAYI